MASRALGPGPPWAQPRRSHSFFVVLKKSLGGRQAKGREMAETAAAEVGAWREAGTPQKRGAVREMKPSNTPPKVGGLNLISP